MKFRYNIAQYLCSLISDCRLFYVNSNGLLDNPICSAKLLIALKLC